MEKMGKTEDTTDESPRIKISHYSSQKEESEPHSKKESQSKSETSEKSEQKGVSDNTNFSSFVAAHYNSIESEFEKRNNSRIFYLRNFNNWVKSILIKESVRKLQDCNQRNLKGLDMCCGKGGDLFKWASLNMRYLVCADIAENSLDQFKIRYKDYMDKCQRNNRHCSLECEFIPADCTRVRLRGKYHDPSIQFDIVSCQFSFHYCFESLPQVECMLKNASECLKPGGLFIGTIPNANEIIKRLKKSEKNSFGNEVYTVEMSCEEPYPLFGAKYNFYLEGVVNCPEFLVHFPTFERLALKFGLKLEKKERFTEFFERSRKTRDGEILLKRMKALETFFSAKDKKVVGPDKDYIHAQVFCEERRVQQVGTLSMSEWEVTSLYLTFVFKKVERT